MTIQDRADKVIAQGCGVYSKHPNTAVRGVYPTHVMHDPTAHTGLLYTGGEWDAHGYHDFMAGLGANLLRPNNVFSLPSVLEVEIAERIVDRISCIDKLKFLKTGSEACSATVRIARAYSDSNGVYGVGYHGHHNMFIEQEDPGAGCVDEYYRKFDTIADLIKKLELPQDGCLIYADDYIIDVGTVIIEPIELDASDNRKNELIKLRDLCSKLNILLIFDEVITGFRVPNYTVSNWWGIEPDLIVMGKAIGNGHPLSLVGGKSEIMDTPDYFISSTFSGDTTSLLGCQHILNEVTETRLIELWSLGTDFNLAINQALKPIDVHLEGYATRGTWKGNKAQIALYWQEMCKRGYLLGRPFFLMFCHTKEILDKFVIESMDVVDSMVYDKVKLEGEMPKEVFQR